MIPPLVAAYLERALPGDRPVPRQVQITQEGQMWAKPAARPRRFSATQRIATDRAAFSWRARFSLTPWLALTVVDEYAAGAGRLEVRLLGRTLQHEQGPETSLGEAMRYLAELPWAPHSMAHNSELVWRQFDARRVQVAVPVGTTTASVEIEFDAEGDIVRASAPARPFRRGNAWEPTPWVGEFCDYEELGSMRMPTSAEVSWQLPEGRFMYWQGHVTSVSTISTPFEPGR